LFDRTLDDAAIDFSPWNSLPIDVLCHGVTVQVSDNLLGNDGQQDDSELSAVQRHRKKKKLQS